MPEIRRDDAGDPASPLLYLAEEDTVGENGEEMTTMFVVNRDGSRRIPGSRPRGTPRCRLTKEEIEGHLFEKWDGLLKRLAEDETAERAPREGR